MNIYVGNLPTDVTDEELRKMFEPFGAVRSAAVGLDKKTGVSEGFGFVEMPVKSEARAAVESLRGKELKGKPLRVRILKPDDPFHNAFRAGSGASSSPGKFRGDVAYRGSGAIRRSGQRGS